MDFLNDCRVINVFGDFDNFLRTLDIFGNLNLNFNWFFNNDFFDKLLRSFIFELRNLVFFIFELLFQKLDFSWKLIVFSLEFDQIPFEGSVEWIDLLEVG